MNRSQRVVLVIALGAAAIVAAVSANLVIADPPGSGWFPLSESTGVTFSPSEADGYFVVMTDRAIIQQASMWLAAIGLWAAASCWLLRGER